MSASHDSKAARTCLAAVVILMGTSSLAGCAGSHVPVTSGESAGLPSSEFTELMARADAVVDARLVAASADPGPDHMDGTLEWEVLATHRGPVAPGSRVITRYKAPFSTSGKFCTIRMKCVDRSALQDYRGERFFVTLSRQAYVQQSGSSKGVPTVGAYSLTYGYYLIRGDELYTNDLHRPPSFGYSQARALAAGST